MTGATDLEGNEIGKLFVGGLAQATNQESLLAYFAKFGEVEEAVVMMDHRTGRSRGFGYVKFSQNGSVEIVMESKPHILDGKEIDAKQCNVHMRGKNRRSLKVFVGGISTDHDANTLKDAFEKYGTVTDVNLMMDHTKQRHRGFAFVGFQEESVVKHLIQLHYVNIGGKEVEIKAMEPPNYEKKAESSVPRANSPSNCKYGQMNTVEYPPGMASYPPGSSSMWRQMQGVSPAVANQVMPPWNMAYSSWPQMGPGVPWPQWSMAPASSGVPVHGGCDFTQPWVPHWPQQWYATGPAPVQHVWQTCPSGATWAVPSMNNPQLSQSVPPGVSLNASAYISSSDPCIQPSIPTQGSTNGGGEGNGNGSYMNLSESKNLSTGSYWEQNTSVANGNPVTMMPCWTQGSNGHMQPSNNTTDANAQHAMGQMTRRPVGSTVRNGNLDYDEQGYGGTSNSVDGVASSNASLPSGLGNNSGDIYNWIYSGMKEIKYVPLLPAENHQTSELQSPDGAAGDYSRPESSLTPFHPTQMFSLPR